MTRERTIDPSRVNQCKGPNGCGRDFLLTPLGAAEHLAYHLDDAYQNRRRTVAVPELRDRFDAWRAYAQLLEKHASDLRGQVADLKDELRDERRRFLEDIATRDDRIEELERDLDHEVRATHELQGRLL
jgi:predicted RNase H-like nuclease (RuvC/YqgF family)